jgi:hypothetical protein
VPILGISGFVNAQYRFVMNPTGDYTVHFADPDMCVPIVIKQTMIHMEQFLPMAGYFASYYSSLFGAGVCCFKWRAFGSG